MTIEGIDRERLKELFLELLREDREFRRVVAAELGLLEILERLDRLEGEMVRVWRRLERLEERVARLEERMAFLEERMLEVEKRLEEHAKAIRALQEQVARMQEQMNRMQEQMMKLQEQVGALASSVEKLTAKVASLGLQYGLFTEEAFREAIRYLVEDLLREYRAETWEYYDSEGIVYGHPSVVQVDVLVKDGVHVLVEYKAFADKPDVAELYRIGLLYEKATGVKPRLLLVAPAIRKRAAELAKKLGVELRGEILEA